MAFDDDQLEEILARARATNDVEHRRLVKQFRALQMVAQHLLANLEPTQRAAIMGEHGVLRWARFLAPPSERETT